MGYKKAQGFTLFEIMVVLLMISVASAAVTIVVNTASSPEKELNKVGRQLFSKMNFALDEALMQRRLIGLRVDSDREASKYSWHVYENERWQLLGSPLSAVAVPEAMELIVSVDDELLDDLLEASLNSLDEDAAPPSIIFYPNSDISEFELSLAFRENDNEKEAFRIYMDERGQLTNSVVEAQLLARQDQ